MEPEAAPRLLNCPHGDCGATFTRPWRLTEHRAAHTGEVRGAAAACTHGRAAAVLKHAACSQKPNRCAVSGCERSFARRSRLRRHALEHEGLKRFRCAHLNCPQAFFSAARLRRHVAFAHGNKDEYFKCDQPNCSASFRKRRLLKLHLRDHNVTNSFKCTKDGCSATFDTHVARKAHEKKHEGAFTCQLCKVVFEKINALRRHKRRHISIKPVLACPKEECHAYFSTTFNLQHHIRHVHLGLLKYHCAFPSCPQMFAMRESMQRHLLHHDPNAVTLKKRRPSKKTWQQRLNRDKRPLVEEDLRRLFTLRMRISRRAKVEADLSGLFSERKIRHYVNPEVNLQDLFGMRRPRGPETTEHLVVVVVVVVGGGSETVEWSPEMVQAFKGAKATFANVCLYTGAPITYSLHSSYI
ncbi:P43 5S RNA-binding protein-like [Pholidichthys leucotaenia]